MMSGYTLKAKVHDVSVLDDIIFSLDSQFASVFNRRFRFMLNQVFQVVDFGTNETLFEIGMDPLLPLAGLSSFSDSSQARFSLPPAVKNVTSLSSFIPGGDHAVESGFGPAPFLP